MTSRLAEESLVNRLNPLLRDANNQFGKPVEPGSRFRKWRRVHEQAARVVPMEGVEPTRP